MNNLRKFSFLLIWILYSLVPCRLVPCPSAFADSLVQSEHGVVISGHPEATRIGIEELRQGGNAADALVAVSLALGVAEPGNSGLGGKIVLLYYDAKSHQVSAMVSLTAAPEKLNVDDARNLSTQERQRGWKSVCTPGLLAGIAAAHDKWGTKPWQSLVQPAANLAENGFVLSPLAAEMDAQFPMEVDPIAAAVYAPGGKHFKAGDRVKNPALAATLRLIAKEGPGALYHGELGEKLVAAAQSHGCAMTMDDLQSFHPRFLPPLSIHYDGCEVYSSPPPLVGGTTMLLSLRCLEAMHAQNLHPRDSKYIDTISRALEQAYPAAALVAGDMPNSSQRVAALLTDRNVKKLADRARSADVRHPYEHSTRAASAFERTLDDGDQASTTHLIIVDSQGDIACATQSLGYHFGAAVMAPGCGFLLNNDMNNFAYATHSSVNFVAPGKWARSTMTPTIVLKNGKPLLAIGSPAGQRIPGAVLQCTLDIIDYDRPLQETVKSPRFHLRRPTSISEPPNIMDLEELAPRNLDGELTKLGWDVHRRSDSDFYFGAVNAVEFMPDGQLVGVADQRRTGDAGAD